MTHRDEELKPRNEVYGLEQRKAMMRDVVRLLAQHGALRIENAAKIAETYNVPTACVEAECMKHLSEGE